MFTVASGLDSMVVGESQILGQVRAAYALGTEAGSVGIGAARPGPDRAAGRQARAHRDRHRPGRRVDRVGRARPRRRRRCGTLDGARVVIVGAGSMGALAGATLRRARRCRADIVVANRGAERAERLAASLRRAARSGSASWPRAIADADVLISSTGATGLVVEAAPDRRARRPSAGRARPGAAARRRPGRRRAARRHLRRPRRAAHPTARWSATTRCVRRRRSWPTSCGSYLAEQQQLAVAPTVTALRARANQVIDAELARLDGRLPGARRRRCAARSPTRCAARSRRCCTRPTVRVKELASTPGGDQYADALRELFDLDPADRSSRSPAVRKSREAR